MKKAQIAESIENNLRAIINLQSQLESVCVILTDWLHEPDQVEEKDEALVRDVLNDGMDLLNKIFKSE